MIMKRVTKRERLQLWTYLNRDDPSVFVAQESQKTGNNFFVQSGEIQIKTFLFAFKLSRFLKNGPIPASFCLFPSFPHCITF